jgi:hypothetical protein
MKARPELGRGGVALGVARPPASATAADHLLSPRMLAPEPWRYLKGSGISW